LGVTPSAWGTFKAIEIASAGSSVISAGSTDIRLTGNAYYNGTNWKYAATNLASMYSQNSGIHEWYIAASGSAGANLCWTTAMTLGASGNVLVGTTASSARLNVVGSASSGWTTAFGNGTAYQGVAGFGNAAIGVGTWNWQSTSIPGSGTAEFYTRFASVTSGGTAIHNVAIDGILLVGTTSQTGKLAVNGDATSASLVTFYSSTAGDVGQAGLLIGKQDNNTTTSQVILRATILSTGAGAGQINMNGANSLAFGTYSDQRLKENIVDLPSQLSNILALHPVEFDYIESEGGGHQTGFIAQEMQAVYADAVGEREDGMLTVSGWSKTEARLVKAIQEQQAIIESLKARLDAANL
jgi:hypothetical protein